MKNEGLADAVAANPFRLLRLHPGIGARHGGRAVSRGDGATRRMMPDFSLSPKPPSWPPAGRPRMVAAAWAFLPPGRARAAYAADAATVRHARAVPSPGRQV